MGRKVKKQVDVEGIMTVSPSRGNLDEKVLILLERKDGTILFRGFMTPDAFGRMIVGFSGQPVVGITFEDVEETP